MTQSMVTRFLRTIVLPRSQIVALFLTGLAIMALGRKARNDFRPLEPAPQLLPVTPEKIKLWGGEPTVVKAGLQVVNFSEFDLIDNDFVFDSIVWFEFDPALVSLDTVSKFSFNKGEILHKSEPRAKLIDGKFFVQYEVRVSFSSSLTHQFFPLDDHRIFITLINAATTPNEIVYEADESSFSASDKIFIRGWSLHDTQVDTGYEEWSLDKYEARRVTRHPKVVFALDFRRFGTRHILLILLPLFLLFFIGVFASGFDPKLGDNITLPLTSGSVASLIAYRFVIVNMAPNVGYFILSDHIFMLFLVFAFLQFSVSIALLRSKKNITDGSSSKSAVALHEALLNVRSVLFVVFHIGTVIAWYYLLFIWI